MDPETVVYVDLDGQRSEPLAIPLPTVGAASSCVVPTVAGRKHDGETPRTLREIDCLLMVNDEARQGALRFARVAGGPFLAPSDATPIPPLVELPRLFSAAEHVVGDSDSDEDVRLLLAPGSSLGGARPKRR